MKASEVVFQKLLDGKIQYVVPLYQRTYNWGDDQWEQLWQDVLEIYAMSIAKNHFIGSVVTQQVPTEPESVSRYTLIDGQQRMTTLFILLSVIRQQAMAEGSEWGHLADEINKTCLINEFNAGEEHIKLQPTQRDREAFASVINGDQSFADSNIEKARKTFEKMLVEGDSNGDKIDLRKLHGCIVNHLDMVSIHLDQEDSPNRIFESLNNTGMPLSVADLIRNFLLMHISDLAEQEKAYNELWYPMEQLLSKGHNGLSTDFFWHYLMKDGELPRKDETYEVIQRHISLPNTHSAITALADFSKFANYYAQIVETGEVDTNSNLQTQIRRLNQWEVSVAYPFLLKALDAVSAEIIHNTDLVDVIQLLESFVVRRTVCGVPTNQLRRIFAQISVQIDFANFVESARSYLLNNRWPDDNEFRSRFTVFPLYSRGRSSRANLVLWALERSFGNKEAPEATDDITIEHIMPQTLSDDWKRTLGSDANDIHDQWLHTIGNLTLSGYNPALGNLPFPDKKTALAKSNFDLNTSLQDLDIWNEDSIKARANELAERALQIWKR